MPNDVDIKADFSELAEFFGSFHGWEETVKTPFHITSLLELAHRNASKQFDKETAIAARGLGVTHMYEWGTIGINDGGDAPPLPPTSRAARLWAHRLSGSGTNRKIDFTFRPSVVDVPLPEGKWGPSQAPKRRHKFYGKAWVTEMGMPVVIKPRYAKALFIPIGENSEVRGIPGSRYSNERAIRQGFAMHPYPVVVRHLNSAGNFSKHWYAWWNTEGRSIINQETSAVVNAEANRVIKTGRRGTHATLGRYADGYRHTKNFQLQVSAAKARANAEMRVRDSDTQRWQQEEFQENMGALGL